MANLWQTFWAWLGGESPPPSKPPALFSEPAANPPPPAPAPSAPPRPPAKTITVAPGDTLFTLAQKHNLPVQAIVQANQLDLHTQIRVGQRLTLPAPAPAPKPAPPTEPVVYRVRRGETLPTIAQTFGLSAAAIRRENNLSEPAQLVAGQWLVIPHAPPTEPGAAKTAVALPKQPPPLASPPKPRPASPDTPLAIPPDAVQGVYLAYHALVNRADYDRIVRLLETTSLNALVIDFKNNWGYLTYPVQTAPAAGAGANRFVVHALPRRLAELKSARIYTVARIVAFKDNLLARTHPHLAAHTSGGGQLWRDERDAAWVNPQHPETWAYILQVALEAARLGFDEIQFDCLRFPRPGPGGQPQFLPPRPLSPQTRARAIAGFLSAARGQLAPFGVKLTATAAGRVCWRRDDSLLGQRLEQMAPYLDAICPHLHPAAFTGNAPGPRNIASRPYSAIFQATRRAVGRLKALRSPCRVRPWIQDFEGNGTARRTFGPAEVRAQIRAVFEGGGAGYMAWDPKLAYTAAAYRRPDSSRSQAG